MSDDAAFYCVCDARYFLGAVATINSLRLHGHREPINLLDLGLEPWQRELLAGEARLVEAPARTAPWLAKTIAPLAHPAQTMVLIDCDVIVTRPLTELLEEASAGRVVAFRNNVDRFVAQWGELLELGPIERRPYLCSVFLAAGGGLGREVIELLDDRQRHVEMSRTFYGSDEDDYPFRFPEQDVLNAVLAARAPAERVSALEARLATPTPFDDVERVDEQGVSCSFADGTRPHMLHHILPAKPWLRSMPESPFSVLLRRLLAAPDVPVRVPPERLPVRFRPGPFAALERRRAAAAARLRWSVGVALHRARTRREA